MFLEQIYKNSQKPVISFEVFPPKENFEEKSQKLIEELTILKQFDPAFISVTYGAGGSTQNHSFEIAMKIKNELSIEIMPHFTCIGASKENVKQYLNLIKNNDISSILALRGDVPQDCEDFEFNNDFRFASDLVEFIKSQTNLSIGVAGYPEVHKEAKNAEQDLINLKKKIDSGANVIITQVFFNNDHYFDFVEKARQIGINTPIIPGILPITNLKQIERMVSMCGSEIPIDLIDQIKKHQDDKKAMKKIGVEFAIEQCRQLLNSDVAGIHFYTLNKASATKEVLKNIL